MIKIKYYTIVTMSKIMKNSTRKKARKNPNLAVTYFKNKRAFFIVLISRNMV